VGNGARGRLYGAPPSFRILDAGLDLRGDGAQVMWVKTCIVRNGNVATVHVLVASNARTSADPTWPEPPAIKTRKPVLCLSAVTFAMCAKKSPGRCRGSKSAGEG
jgi:hypothetical protein